MSEYPHLIRLNALDRQGVCSQFKEFLAPLLRYGTPRNILLSVFILCVLFYFKTSTPTRRKHAPKKKARVKVN